MPSPTPFLSLPPRAATGQPLTQASTKKWEPELRATSPGGCGDSPGGDLNEWLEKPRAWNAHPSSSSMLNRSSEGRVRNGSPSRNKIRSPSPAPSMVSSQVVWCDEKLLRQLLQEELGCAVQELKEFLAADLTSEACAEDALTQKNNGLFNADDSERFLKPIEPEPQLAQQISVIDPQPQEVGANAPDLNGKDFFETSVVSTKCLRRDQYGELPKSGSAISDGTGLKWDVLSAEEYLKTQDPQQFLKDKYVPQQFYAIVEWFAQLEEPAREGPWAAFVDGRLWEATCTVAILLNAVLTMFSTNYEAVHYSDESESNEAYVAIDCLFILFYTMELFFKASVHRVYLFWCDNMYWNLFDFALVLTGAHDFVKVVIIADTDKDRENLTFLRVIRLLKMARILRIFRLIRSLRELRLVLTCLLGSLTSLLWAVIMMLLIFFMFGLVFVQNASAYLRDNDDTLDAETIDLVQSEFGSVERAMLGLFMATTGGNDWGAYYTSLMPVGPITCLVYLFFVAFTQIALLNVLTGIFVENALKLAQPDRYAVYAEEQRQYVQRARELQAIMNGIDLTKDGAISEQEFTAEMLKPEGKLKAYLGALGIHESDAARFFHMLQVGSYEEAVQISTFVCGILKLTGEAQSLDIQVLMAEMKLVHQKVHKMWHGHDRVMKALQSMTAQSV